jgi:hypothetical protein
MRPMPMTFRERALWAWRRIQFATPTGRDLLTWGAQVGLSPHPWREGPRDFKDRMTLYLTGGR